MLRQPPDKPPDRGVAAGKIVAPDKGAVDSGGIDAVGRPGRYLVAMGLHQGRNGWFLANRAKNRGQFRLIRQRAARVEPAVRLCKLTKPAGFFPAHHAGTGQGAVGFPKPHAGYDLTVLIHLEPPIGHGVFLQKKWRKYPGYRKVRESRMSRWRH